MRGCKACYQKQIVANDALNYDLDILGLSETHIKGEGLEEIRAFQKTNIATISCTTLEVTTTNITVLVY